MTEITTDLGITDTEYELWRNDYLNTFNEQTSGLWTDKMEADIPKTLSGYITWVQDNYRKAGTNSKNWQQGIQQSNNIFNGAYNALNAMYAYKPGGPKYIENNAVQQ